MPAGRLPATAPLWRELARTKLHHTEGLIDLHQLKRELSQDLAPLTARGWLATQPEALQRWAAGAGRWRFFENHQMLYQAGEEPDGLYGLGAGALDITLPLVGGEPVTIHRAEPGFWIGDSAILAQTTRLITVAAAAKSRVFFIPATAVRAVVAQRPEYWPCFFALNHLNASTAVTALAEALSLSPKARLARMLLRLAGDGDQVTASQADLARLIGMNRSSLQRALQELIEAGALATGYRRLRVLDRERLESVTDEA